MRPAAIWFGGWNAAAAIALTLIAFALAFNLGSTFRIAYYEEQAFALAVGIGLFLSFHRAPAAGRPALQVAVEAMLAWALLAGAAYFTWRFDDYAIAVVTTPTELVVGGAVVALAMLEAVRRTAGLALVIVIAVILAYTLFGQHLPTGFAAPKTDIASTLVYVVADANAILGSPIAVAVVVVIPFVFMGEVLRVSSGSSFFTDIAMALVGRSPGGSAKAAIVSSGLFGSVSGSAVANVAATGVITIPLMKRGGYSAERAGAIEAVASTGGQLVPPVMGAAAFLMAEFLQVSYATIVLAAIVPSVLYYGSLFIAADLIARRDGIGGADLERGRAGAILKSGWFFLLGLVGLLGLLLFAGFRPEAAAFYAAAFFAACGLLFGYGGQRMSWRALGGPAVATGRSAVDIIVISAAAGVVIGLLNVSGLSISLSLFLIQLSQNSVVLLLVLTALVSIVLGMGMPTTGVYVLLAAIVAPALIKLGVLPLAAHFFIFYFGMLSMITPPVAMAAYAGASIAKGDAMRTGWTAVALGWPAFILPFLMVETPALLFVGAWWEIVLEAALAALGVAAITAAVYGFWRAPMTAAVRAGVAAAGLLCLLSIVPGGLFMAVRIGAALLLLLFMAGALNRALRQESPRRI